MGQKPLHLAMKIDEFSSVNIFKRFFQDGIKKMQNVEKAFLSVLLHRKLFSNIDEVLLKCARSVDIAQMSSTNDAQFQIKRDFLIM